MRSKLFCLFVVFCAAAMMFIAGCAKSSNPLSVSPDNSGGPISIVTMAKTAAGTTVASDTFSQSTNIISSAKGASAALLDSIIGVCWRFGDGTFQNCLESGSICTVVHDYLIAGPGTYAESLVVMLKGNIVRTVWKHNIIIPDNLMPSVITTQESLFVFLGKTPTTRYNYWNEQFGVGVGALARTALNDGVLTVSPAFEGGNDSLWSLKRQIPLTQKTADGKFWIVNVPNVKDSADHTIRIDINSGRFLWWSEIEDNALADSSTQIFVYSTKVDGSCVPKTTNYGVRGVIPPDTSIHSPFPAGIVMDTGASWVLGVSLNTARDTSTYWLNFKKLGCVGNAAFVVTNMPVPSQPVTMLPGDTIGTWAIATSSYPIGGLTLINYGRGTCTTTFAGSQFATVNGTVTFVSSSAGVLSKKAR